MLCFSLMIGHPLFSANNPQGEKPHPISLRHPTIPFPLRSCFGFIPKLAYLRIMLPVMEQFVILPFINFFFLVRGLKIPIKSTVLFLLALLKITDVS